MELILTGAVPEASLKTQPNVRRNVLPKVRHNVLPKVLPKVRLSVWPSAPLDVRKGAWCVAQPKSWGRRLAIVIRRAALMLGTVVALAATATAHAQSVSPADAATADTRPVVVLKTSEGDIVLELDRERAPATVKNFMAYVGDDFYTDTLFHRVIDGFMIQGGGFTQDYRRKPTMTPVSNEAYNGLTNRKYTIAMARTTAPHSATSQFFINTADNRNLDHTDTTQRGWGYTVFGEVIDGTEVVDAISRTRTGPGGPFSRDAPVEPVIILGVERVQEAQSDSSAVSPSDSSAGSAAEPSTLPSTDAEPVGNVVTAKPDSTDSN